MTIYNRARNNGVQFESTCADITKRQWDKLMEGATRANRREVVKIAMIAGVIDAHQGREELKKPYFNPYNHFKTKTHIIYVQSGIEHFIKVTDDEPDQDIWFDESDDNFNEQLAHYQQKSIL